MQHCPFGIFPFVPFSTLYSSFAKGKGSDALKVYVRMELRYLTPFFHKGVEGGKGGEEY